MTKNHGGVMNLSMVRNWCIFLGSLVAWVTHFNMEAADISCHSVSPPVGERVETMEAYCSGPQALHKACDTDLASP